MKLILILSVFALFALATAVPQGHSRGCIYIEGNCVEECEEGTHEYTRGCAPITPEATCEEPNPKLEEDETCDYSACHCDPPTVREKISGKCVTLDKCPKNVPKEDDKESAAQ